MIYHTVSLLKRICLTLLKQRNFVYAQVILMYAFAVKKYINFK